jgi:hypothetical protein
MFGSKKSDWIAERLHCSQNHSNFRESAASNGTLSSRQEAVKEILSASKHNSWNKI